MNPETEKTLAFFGKMTANLTHEIKNVLAIIQESAGLMEDITAICPLGEEKYQERFNRSMATIKQQLHRGMDLTTQFNRFAHTPDRSRVEVDLVETVEQFCTLTARFARLKNIELVPDQRPESKDRIRLTTNPVQLFMALFCCLESCLHALPANSTIRVIPGKDQDSRAMVEFACTGKQVPAPKDFFHQLKAAQAWSELENGVIQIGVTVTCNSENLRFRLVF